MPRWTYRAHQRLISQMYIVDENGPTYNFKVPGMDEPIDLDGPTQVTAEVGEMLIEEFDSITEHNE